MNRCTCDTVTVLSAVLEGRQPPPCAVHDHTVPAAQSSTADKAPGLNSTQLENDLRAALGAE